MELFAPTVGDVYKTGHPGMIPDNVHSIYSNFTPRSFSRSPIPGIERCTTNGIQGVVKDVLRDMWNNTFFHRPKEEVITRYKNRVDGVVGSAAAATAVTKMAELHDLGYLPLRVKALREGLRVNPRIPHYTICSTRQRFAWTTNYVETQMSSPAWKALTTATIASEFRTLLLAFAEMTGVDPAFVDIQAHDFSARGMSGNHDAAQSGTGHVLNFLGSDTMHTLDFIDQFYRGKESGFLACSVPASEHMIACINMALNGGINFEGEIQYVHGMLDLYKTDIVSIVSDTLDFFRLVMAICEDGPLKRKILARQRGPLGLCKTVLRPDSGDPVKIICGEAWPVKALDIGSLYDVRDAGYKYALYKGGYYRVEQDTPGHYVAVPASADEITPQLRGAVQLLWEGFGGTVTKTGFRTLDEHIGLIYGDSITYDRALKILTLLARMGFSSANIVLGIGSYTYQYITRDSLGVAIKATQGEADVTFLDERGNVLRVERQGFELFKDPATDDGTKRSAVGLLRVELNAAGDYILHERQTWEQEGEGELRTILNDSIVLPEGDVRFSDNRARLWPILALEASALLPALENTVAANDYGYVELPLQIAVA